MKTVLAGLLLAVFAVRAEAKPSPAVIEACLRTASDSPTVRYTPIPVDSFQVTEDEEAGKTDITLSRGQDTVGTWEVRKPHAFGLVYNGKETPLARVTRLDKRMAPTVFNPYEAIWGEAREGRQSYICATFNFEGLGKSGSFQNVRGLYLIEDRERGGTAFYTSGNIGAGEK